MVTDGTTPRPIRMRLASRIVSVTVLSLLLALTLPAGEARACSCVPSSPSGLLADADAAFVGRLLEAGEPTPDREGIINMGQEVTYRFEVKTVVAGELPGEVEVLSPTSGAACGFELEPGETAGVVLYREDGAWSSGLCSTTEPGGLLAAGDPHPPVAAPTPTEAAPGRTGGREGGPGPWPWVAAGLGVLVAAGAGAWVRHRIGAGS